jgi:8-oxo-dGTP pyrophosphatase MutT (NUDIX family)
MADTTEVEKAYEDALEDVHTRFILNLPPEELETADRIFFQLEQAYWFYDDFHCDCSVLPLPRFKSLKPFASKMFQMSPLLSEEKFLDMWEQFSSYKRGISTYGTILLNDNCDKIVLCQIWKSKSWTFPAGKVNQNESGIEAGSRETYEETGFDPNCCFGKAKEMLENGDVISWGPLREEDSLAAIDAGKRRTLYVCKGVPIDFPFAPIARKEVETIQWHDIDDLPKKTFAVLPFIKQLRRWIKQQSRNVKKQSSPYPKRPCSNKRIKNENTSRGRNNSRGRVHDDDSVAKTGLANPGDLSGWTESDMFKANEKIIGKKIHYDGNPHIFVEKGFNGVDPHAFRIVGGSFMNSNDKSQLASPLDRSRFMATIQNYSEEEEEELRPFFSTRGETPWGEVVSHAQGPTPPQVLKSSKSDRMTPLSLQSVESDQNYSPDNPLSGDHNLLFLTDLEITNRRQGNNKGIPTSSHIPSSIKMSYIEHKKKQLKNIEENKQFIQLWIQKLQNRDERVHKDTFRFEVHPIMGAMSKVIMKR